MTKLYLPSFIEIRNLIKIIGRLEVSLGFSSLPTLGTKKHVSFKSEVYIVQW